MSPRQNRRRYKRRARFGFFYKLMAVLAVLAAVVMGATVFFRVEEIVVAGNARYTAQQVIDATADPAEAALYRGREYSPRLAGHADRYRNGM